MDKQQPQGLTHYEVDKMIREQLDKHDHLIREMGCQSKHGCLAGKKHFQEHELKWSSDLMNLKLFQEDQEQENKLISRKLSETANVFHDVVKDLSHLLNSSTKLEKKLDKYKIEMESDNQIQRKDQNKRIDVYELRFWLMVIVVVGACLTAVMKINTSVTKVNQGDLLNQKRTETMLTLLLSELSGKPVDEIITKLKKHFKPISKTDGNKKEKENK